MDNLKFKVSAELKNILGKDLITSPNIAILELVKNSYDAHATKVEITFEEDRIVIADNGKGMSLDDLVNKWLFVAYSAKSDGTEDKSYRSKFKRHYAGAKGIGRMSCDRLARFLTLTTRSEEGGSTEVLDIDWTSFDNHKQEEFNSIDVPHDTKSDIPSFPEGQQTGTILDFKVLHNVWGKQEILSLRKSLEKMINPFSGGENFQIEIIVPAEKENDRQMLESVVTRDAIYDSLSMEDKPKLAADKNSIVNGVVSNSIADVLRVKTTQIESVLKDGIITTKLSDRGVLIYEIEEMSKYPDLEDATINLFYLNRAAKYNFSLVMGIQPVRYGNVFLFRNGFRIWPYGEDGDDSWGLNRRLQQGHNRSLGTRDLLGRVDVETDDVEAIKEVSSRDGGLIMTKHALQLLKYFEITHRRLERYVVGVLWGEAFLRNDYFKNDKLALEARADIQKGKDSDSADGVFKNIGSKIDFLQLVKSLVNDSSISIRYYNESLANIVENVSDIEIIQAGFIDDLRKVAQKTNDDSLNAKIDDFEQQLAEMRRQKEEAERIASEERKKTAEARRIAELEKAAREKVERELSQKKKQNLFLQSVSSLDKDRILKFHHDIRIHSGTIINTIARISKLIQQGRFKQEELPSFLDRISRANGKIMTIAQYATKANFNVAGDDINADYVEYIAQYVNAVLPEFYDDKHLSCITGNCSKVMSFNPLEASLMVDNLVANAIKAGANSFAIQFEESSDGKLTMIVTDDGKGLSSEISDPDEIFLKGVTTTNGSGLGLYNIAQYVKDKLRGAISVNNETAYTDCGFKLIIKF